MSKTGHRRFVFKGGASGMPRKLAPALRHPTQTRLVAIPAVEGQGDGLRRIDTPL